MCELILDFENFDRVSRSRCNSVDCIRGMGYLFPLQYLHLLRDAVRPVARLLLHRGYGSAMAVI